MLDPLLSSSFLSTFVPVLPQNGCSPTARVSQVLPSSTGLNLYLPEVPEVSRLKSCSESLIGFLIVQDSFA